MPQSAPAQVRSILIAPRIDSSDSNMAVLRELDCMFQDIFRHPGTFGPIFIKDFLFPVGCGIHTPINGMKIGKLAQQRAGMLVCVHCGLHCLVETEWTLTVNDITSIRKQCQYLGQFSLGFAQKVEVEF